MVKQNVKSLRFIKNLKGKNVRGVQVELESKIFFQTQAVTMYLRLTLVSMEEDAPRE